MPTLPQLKQLIAKYEGALEEREVLLAATAGDELEPQVVELSVGHKNFDITIDVATLKSCIRARLTQINSEIQHLARILDIQ